MIKNLIFDLDGTLVDDYEEMLSIFSDIVYKYSDVKKPETYIQEYRNRGTRWLLEKLKIAGNAQVSMVKELLLKLNKTIMKTKLHKNVKETLNLLSERGVELGLLTSNNERNIKEFLKFHDINLFSFIYPNAGLFSKFQILLDILKKEGLNNKETAYIGDEDRDILAAKKAGLVSIAVSWGFNSEKHLKTNHPTYLFKFPSDLLKIADSN